MGNDKMRIVKIKSLSKELAKILEDYENYKVTQDSVFEWITQFDKIGMTKKEMEIILGELIRIFKFTYFQKDKIKKFLKRILKENKHKNFSFLNIQDFRKSDIYKSSSQNDYINLLKKEFPDIKINDYKSERLIYFDDYLLSGHSIQNDLKYLKDNNLLKKTKFYFLLVTTNGIYQVEKNFNNLTGKCIIKIENRLTYSYKSDVLWPYENEIKLCENFSYSNMKFREKFEKSLLFDCDNNRKLIEDWFWKAGCYIKVQNRTELLPLGSGYPETVGTGIITATYRNIPNNAPICLWWDMDFWKPLLKRKTNKEQKKNSIFDDISRELNEWLQNL